MIAVVTGASSGFGAAIARRLHATGAQVILVGRRADRLEAVRAGCGDRALALPLDVRDRGAVARAFETLPADFAEVDVLVNNAGLALGLESAQRASLDDWDAMVATNISGLLYCTRALLPGMIARNRGHVVNMGSTAAEFPYPGGNVYGATKAFVYQLTLNLRADLLGTPVRVTDIEPGLTGGTEFSTVRFHGDAAKAAAVYAEITPLSPDDVADAVMWAVTRPPHVNINVITLMPVCQAFGPLAVARQPAPAVAQRGATPAAGP